MRPSLTTTFTLSRIARPSKTRTFLTENEAAVAGAGETNELIRTAAATTVAGKRTLWNSLCSIVKPDCTKGLSFARAPARFQISFAAVVADETSGEPRHKPQ
jgi:hypothetical protein